MNILAVPLGGIDTILEVVAEPSFLDTATTLAIAIDLTNGVWTGMLIISLNINKKAMNTCHVNSLYICSSIDSRVIKQYVGNFGGHFTVSVPCPWTIFLWFWVVLSLVCGLIGCNSWFQIDTVLYLYQLREGTWDQTFHLNQLSSVHCVPIKWKCFWSRSPHVSYNERNHGHFYILDGVLEGKKKKQQQQTLVIGKTSPNTHKRKKSLCQLFSRNSGTK